MGYASVEIETFQLPPKSKVPPKGSTALAASATSDPRKVEREWRANPNANIALLPYRSRLYVLDFDLTTSADPFCSATGEVAASMAVGTGVGSARGGHLYFADNGLLKTKVSAVPGLDVFGQQASHGYVVAPHSQHPEGPFYEFLTAPPWEVYPAPMPPELAEWLVEYTTKHKQSKASTRESVVAQDIPDAGTSSLAEYDRDPRFVRAWCEFMGVPFKTEKAFHSPLRNDQHPSVSIHLNEKGYYRYHDFTQPGMYWSLAQVYGAKVTGKEWPLPQLGRFEFPVWQTRLLLELGWVEPPVAVSVAPLPPNAPVAARIAYEGFRLLLQARAVYLGDVQPAPYSFGFCSTWTGLNSTDAKAGVVWLWRNAYIERADEYSRGGRVTGLYLPSTFIAATENDPLCEGEQYIPF
jgi:hypothetical protein